MFLRRIPSSFHSDKPESTDDVTKEVFEKAFTCWKTNDITGQQKQQFPRYNHPSTGQPKCTGHVNNTQECHWSTQGFRLLPDRSRTCVPSCGCAEGRLWRPTPRWGQMRNPAQSSAHQGCNRCHAQCLFEEKNKKRKEVWTQEQSNNDELLGWKRRGLKQRIPTLTPAEHRTHA